MINLLPDDVKAEIVYARRNSILLRWIIAVGLVIVAVGAMTGFGQLFIASNTKKIDTTAQLTKDRISKQNLASTQAELKTLSDNFKTVAQLLSKQFLFSKIFVKIGGVIPQGAILSGITLSNTSSALDLNVNAVSREVATQSFVNISDPSNGLFEKADLITINCVTKSTSSDNPTSKYPCSATIKVVLKPNSDFYFLNSITGARR